MTGGVDQERRRVLGTAAMTIAAAHLGKPGAVNADDGGPGELAAIGRAANSPRLTRQASPGKSCSSTSAPTPASTGRVRFHTGGGNGTAVEPRLYQMIRQAKLIVERQFEIEFLDAGVETFAFTFG